MTRSRFPRPDAGAVRIDVHAAGVGFVDTLVTRGKYQVRLDPPFTPRMEVAGIVADAPDRSGLRVDRICVVLRRHGRHRADDNHHDVRRDALSHLGIGALIATTGALVAEIAPPGK